MGDIEINKLFGLYYDKIKKGKNGSERYEFQLSESEVIFLSFHKFYSPKSRYTKIRNSLYLLDYQKTFKYSSNYFLYQVTDRFKFTGKLPTGQAVSTQFYPVLLSKACCY